MKVGHYAESDYLNAENFAGFCAKAGVDPFSEGLDAEIAGVEEAPVYDRALKKRVPKPLIHLKETNKPLVGSRPVIRGLIALYGDESDDWKGRPITLILAKGEGGQGGAAIRIAPEAPAEGSSRRRSAKAREHQYAPDEFGAKTSAEVAAKLEQRGLSINGFIAWAKDHGHAEAVAPKDVARWKRSVLQLIKGYIDDEQQRATEREEAARSHDRANPPHGGQHELEDAMSGKGERRREVEVDDIPF